MLSKDELKRFLSDRPALARSPFIRECGYSISYLNGVLNGTLDMTKQLSDSLIPVMRKYGYDK